MKIVQWDVTRYFSCSCSIRRTWNSRFRDEEKYINYPDKLLARLNVSRESARRLLESQFAHLA